MVWNVSEGMEVIKLSIKLHILLFKLFLPKNPIFYFEKMHFRLYHMPWVHSFTNNEESVVVIVLPEFYEFQKRNLHAAGQLNFFVFQIDDVTD